jgi:hypothetical protein
MNVERPDSFSDAPPGRQLSTLRGSQRSREHGTGGCFGKKGAALFGEYPIVEMTGVANPF